MYTSSPKWFNMETSRPTSNYVTVSNSTYQGNSNTYLAKSQSKNEENLFKSNLLTRYSSQ